MQLNQEKRIYILLASHVAVFLLGLAIGYFVLPHGDERNNVSIAHGPTSEGNIDLERIFADQLSNDWKTVMIDQGLGISYPGSLELKENKKEPFIYLRLEGVKEGHSEIVSISAAHLNNSNKSLNSWMQSYYYFEDRYRNQEYKMYARRDGFEVHASFNNEHSYDDAFIRVGKAIVYARNGVNEHTKISEGEFRELIERIPLEDLVKQLATSKISQSCLPGGSELTDLYYGSVYRASTSSAEFIYAPGSYCELFDGSKLTTMGYEFYDDKGFHQIQSIALFDKEDKLLRAYKGFICDTAGDFDSARILSVENETINLFCLSSDAGSVYFRAYQAPLTTLIPQEIEKGTSQYNTLEEAVKNYYSIDFKLE